MDDNKKFWDRFAFIYERVQKTGKLSKKFYEDLENKIIAQLNLNMKVLELAMGPAMLTKGIAENCKTLYATDFSAQMVEKAKNKELPENTVIEQADATNLPYEDESFDAVIIANALHIMPEPQKAIKEIKRVMRKDGVLIAPTYTRELTKNKFKLFIMNAVGFVTYFPWNNESYKKFLQDQGLIITYNELMMWADFPESFVVCKIK